MKQEELINRAGSFCGFGKVGAKFAENGFVGGQKSS
jgi:hypothetical protein